ncbi:MAG TPA: DUF4238 domain-containing protein [Gemmatimonadaceae bacterium]|nr:DUF4238 domain-containing protein [Gemmatimonadaceae bacterium]
MAAITTNNHSVPQNYLLQWSEDGRQVMAYRLLVPDARYPLWQKKSVRSLTAYEHLYTSMADGEPSDKFERWLNATVESPAAPSLAKVRNNAPLTATDWQSLAYFAMALDLRTPVSYMEHNAYCTKTLPEIMDRVLAQLPRRLREAKQKGVTLDSATVDESFTRFPATVRFEQGAPNEKVQVRAEITVNRELWLFNMKGLLERNATLVRRHHWTILNPHAGCEWFTSDHPVVRLNYYSADKYDFGGGWGNKGTEILLPLSPDHLLYTKVGYMPSMTGSLSLDMTAALQRFIAERAHRWIIARGTPKRVEWIRPRVVDQYTFTQEETAWRHWHRAQSDSPSA